MQMDKVVQFSISNVVEWSEHLLCYTCTSLL